MLTIPSTPELERRLQEEAAKRGMQAPEYALRLIEGLLLPTPAVDEQEAARLAAIDAALGVAVDVPFSSEDLHRERQRETEREERRFAERFG